MRQPFLLILAAHRCPPADQFAKVLRACVVIAFRYNVIGNQPTNEQERVYYAAAQKIQAEALDRATPVLDALATSIPAMRRSRRCSPTGDPHHRLAQQPCRQVHPRCELERQFSRQDFEFESDSFNVEHVLPQNPQQDWAQFQRRRG